MNDRPMTEAEKNTFVAEITDSLDSMTRLMEMGVLVATTKALSQAQATQCLAVLDEPIVIEKLCGEAVQQWRRLVAERSPS